MALEANTAEQAARFFGEEAAHAELVREAFTDGTIVPLSRDKKVIPSRVLEMIQQAAEDYETAMKTALGYYMTSVTRESAQGQLTGGQQNGWRNPSYR